MVLYSRMYKGYKITIGADNDNTTIKYGRHIFIYWANVWTLNGQQIAETDEFYTKNDALRAGMQIIDNLTKSDCRSRLRRINRDGVWRI